MEKIIGNLLDLTEKQSQNIQLLTSDVEQLTSQMQGKPSKRSSYGLSIVLTLVTLVAVFSMFFQLKTNSDLVKDCVSVEGGCRQQRLQDTADSNLELLCNDEKQTVFVLSVLEQPYQTIPECIPFIEQALQIDIPEDGRIPPGSINIDNLAKDPLAP